MRSDNHKIKNVIQYIVSILNRWSLLLVIIGLFMGLPIFTFIFSLFWGPGEMWEHVAEHLLLGYTLNSIYLLIGTGGLSVCLGVAAAWVVSNYTFYGRRLIQALLFVPLAIPSYIMAYTYVGVFDHGGIYGDFVQLIGLGGAAKLDIMNIYGLIWVLSISLFPYVYASSLAFFTGQPASMRSTARLLGVSETQFFWRVALPLAQPAIFAGLFLVLMEVLNDYGAAKYFGVNTFTTGIFKTWTALEDLQTAIYLAVLLIALAVFINLIEKIRRVNKRYISQQEDGKAARLLFKPIHYFIYYSFFLFLIGSSLFLPLGQLIYWAILTIEQVNFFKLFNIASQSCILALVTSFCVLILAILILKLKDWNPLKSLNFIPQFITIGYVVPAAIIGIGIISMVQIVVYIFEYQFNMRVGYIFYGSSFVLIYAYCFRFLAVAHHPLSSSTLKIGTWINESSYLLGKTKWTTFFRIELPLWKTAIASSFILCFIDVMKELPLTLILKPYDLDTLAVKAYEFADDERITEVGWPALSLIVIVGVMMLIVNLWSRKSKL